MLCLRKFLYYRTVLLYHRKNSLQSIGLCYCIIGRIRCSRSDCPIVSSEKFVAVDVDVCTAPIRVDKGILEFVQSSKNIIEEDAENEMNNAAPLCSHVIRNEEHYEKYVKAHFNGEMNKTKWTTHRATCRQNLMLKKTM
ncbi:hypothetical protein TNCV_2451961 [Trichonephila clavipes]|nr:hypothetical protein TNCV_2451961 [Trichonephila clavipes]